MTDTTVPTPNEVASTLESMSMEDIAKIAKPFGVKIFVCEMIDEMPHELITANLRSAKPFTKEAIEKFIESDATIADIRKTLEEEKMELKTFYIIANE